jgi:hypothetical protein
MDLFSLEPEPATNTDQALAKTTRSPKTLPGIALTLDEREGIVLAVTSVFRKVKNLYTTIQPIFDDYGFKPPSAGVIARDLSEKIEKSITQHCSSFTKGVGHCDLGRFSQEWEVKICKDSGLTINQSKVIKGENYIVVNYKANSLVKSVWVLWQAQDEFFSPRLPNSNARSIVREIAKGNIEVLFDAKGKQD